MKQEEAELNATFMVPFQYSVQFVDRLFQTLDPRLAELVEDRLVVSKTDFSSDSQDITGVDSATLDNRTQSRKLLFVVERLLTEKHPNVIQDIEQYCQYFGLVTVAPLVLLGGESGKSNSESVEQIIDACIEYQIDRHSYIVAIGGGAFLDMAGYAAAISHRGIRLIRIPTTVLAQNDAGIGVKTALNYRGRKNFIGTFSPPYAVINDFSLLSTLDERDMRAGIAEAIKVALIKDQAFFSSLSEQAALLACFDEGAMKAMIYRCAELHLLHICGNGDPFERGSARPLDFGHWTAHALEELSDFTIKHGEAVAIGILIDSLYSFKMGWISEDDYLQIATLIETVGFAIDRELLNRLDIAVALDNFRAHLGGELCITLLSAIGRSVEVNYIDIDLMMNCVAQLAQKRLSSQVA